MLVFDADGYFMAAGLAERLRAEGRDVEIVTPHDRVAPSATRRWRALLRQHLHDLGIRQRPGTMLAGIEPGRVTAADQFGDPVGSRPMRSSSSRSVSRTALYRELKADGGALAEEDRGALPDRGLRRAADIAEAIFDGHRLGREIDSENPAIPSVPARAARARPGPSFVVRGSAPSSRGRCGRSSTWLHLSDGTRLAARIWLPRTPRPTRAGGRRVPALPQGRRHRRRATPSASRTWPGTATRPCGWTCAARESDGVLTDEYTQQEQDDALEILAWLREQPWCDGRLGLWGISWGGFNSRCRSPRSGRRGSGRS